MRFIPAVLWAGLLFFLSSQSTLPTISTTPGFDKVEHLGAYAILGALLAWAFRSRRALLWAWIAGSLYGVSDELHQLFVPGRSADVFDALADSIGSALGAGGLGIVERWASTRSKRSGPASTPPASSPRPPT